MPANLKKEFVSLNPEWGPELERLKAEKFAGASQAEMFRYLIRLGLNQLNDKSDDIKEQL